MLETSVDIKNSVIKPIGDFLIVDGEGYLINPCRSELIVSPWAEVVEDVKKAYLHYLPEKIHSLYVRGSVAKGKAIEEVSDIDMIVVVRGDCEEVDQAWIPNF